VKIEFGDRVRFRLSGEHVVARRVESVSKPQAYLCPEGDVVQECTKLLPPGSIGLPFRDVLFRAHVSHK
jgi:hypothetical protein